VSQDDPQRTEEWTPPEMAEEEAERRAALARGAELKAELRETQVRRAEEETAQAHDEVEAAERNEEKLSRKERKAREKAAAAEAEAERARREADDAARVKIQTGTPAVEPSTVSGAHVMSPGLGSETDPAVAASAAAGGGAYRQPVPAAPGEESTFERPEVVAGVVFAGAFLLARIFKRLVD
jgi:membrane protein involved in colicin uptake